MNKATSFSRVSHYKIQHEQSKLCKGWITIDQTNEIIWNR